MRVLILCCIVAAAKNSGAAFYIESRSADGSLTDVSLYEESGSWYGPGSTAKSTAPAPELPGGVLQGQGSRFSDNALINAAALFKISAHPEFVPGKAYNLFITTPSAASIDAANSTFVIFDDEHPESAPLAAGIVPLTQNDSGNVWLTVAENIVLGSGATLKIAEAAPQGNRFYADAIKISLYMGDSNLTTARRANLNDASRWEFWPSWLSAPSPGADVQSNGGKLTFTVPEQGAQMKWRHSMRPAWLDIHPYLTITYAATGLQNAVTTPVVRLCTQSESWFTAFTSIDIVADGVRRTRTIDLRTKTGSPQIIGVEVILLSDQSSGATFILEEFSFNDAVPGFEFPPPSPPQPATMGFTLDVSAAGAWQAMPEWVGETNASTDYAVQSTGSSLLFTVNDSLKGMKWRNIAIGAHDTSAYPWLVMKYRCRNLQESAYNYAVWLAGGGSEARPLYLSDLIDDGLWHWAVAPIDIPTANQMAIQVQSNTYGKSFLEIEELGFADNDPRTSMSHFTALVEGWDDLTSGVDIFKPVDLGGLFNASAGQLLPRMGIGVPWFADDRVSIDDRVPFALTTGTVNLVCTGIPETESLVIPIGRAASEIYLLLGTFLPGRENPQSENFIVQVDETERLVVEVQYAGGEVEQFFPVEVSTRQHKITNNSFSGFAVPAKRAKTIAAIHLHDRTDGGLFALAAVTLNTSNSPFYTDSFKIPHPIVVSKAAAPPAHAPVISFDPPLLTVENTYNRYVFDLSAELEFMEWTSHFTNHDLLSDAPDGRFFSGHVDAVPFTSLDFIPGEVVIFSGDAASTAVIPLRLKNYEDVIQAVLTIHVNESPQAQFSIRLNNAGAVALPFELTFPDLRGLTLGPDPADLYYAYPNRTFINSSAPISITQPYSGKFPMQFMSLYNPPAGWGVSLVVRDLDLISKNFSLSKNGFTGSMSVTYPTLPGTGLRAGARLETAPVALGVHAGDWHTAMEFYLDWVNTWYAPRSPRQQWFQEIYACRRDYPIGGTWHLFDRPRNEYTFQREIDNAARYLGGADLIDISSWGWSATYGRIGEYRLYELGGLENFRSGIALSQGQGVPVGLYIEGYGLDERCTIYQQHGDEWKIIQQDGTDRRSGTEVIICPYPADWQAYMKQLYADVAAETNAAAMYLDVVGDATFFRCYRTDHEHDPGAQPLRGEYQLTRAVREGLNSVRTGIPLYTEYTPVDVTSQYEDGSFSYTIFYGDAAISPTMTNLFRFAFPDFKQIELVNGQFLARNWTEEGLKKAFMNGEGIWVKGDIPAWYDQNTVDFYIKSHEIFRDHRDAFTTPAPAPFIPVRAGNVWAHRFAAGDKRILTFYNSNRRNVTGDLVAIGSVEDVHVVDLWAERMIDTVPGAADNYTVFANLPPRDIGCVGIFKRRMNVQCANAVLSIEMLPSAAGSHIALTGVYPDRRDTRVIPGGGADMDIVLSELFDPLPLKILVKLVRDGVVIDEVIVTDFAQWPPSGLDSWVLF